MFFSVFSLAKIRGRPCGPGFFRGVFWGHFGEKGGKFAGLFKLENGGKWGFLGLFGAFWGFLGPFLGLFRGLGGVWGRFCREIRFFGGFGDFGRFWGFLGVFGQKGPRDARRAVVHGFLIGRSGEQLRRSCASKVFTLCLLISIFIIGDGE